MRIESVDVIVLAPETVANVADSSQDAVLIRVRTDDGLDGYGEVDASPAAVKAIVEAPRSHALTAGLRELLIGQDPRDIEAIWSRLYKGTMFFGRRGVAVMAISGVDLALHDVVGKAYGVPAYQLLGGARRTSVQAYASTLMPDTPQEAADHAEALVGKGFRALKFGWGPLGRDDGLDVALVAAIRDRVGPDIDLMIDIGHGWRNAVRATRQARRLRDYGLRWIEEPLPPDDIEGYRRLRECSEVPIAFGEENTTRYEFQHIFAAGALDIAQPDVARCGGLTEAKRIAILADLYGVAVVPHAWSTGIVSTASAHLCAVLEHADYVEYCVRPTELNTGLVSTPLEIRDGVAYLSDKPGLGIEIDNELVQRYGVAL